MDFSGSLGRRSCMRDPAAPHHHYLRPGGQPPSRRPPHNMPARGWPVVAEIARQLRRAATEYFGRTELDERRADRAGEDQLTIVHHYPPIDRPSVETGRFVKKKKKREDTAQVSFRGDTTAIRHTHVARVAARARAPHVSMSPKIAATQASRHLLHSAAKRPTRSAFRKSGALVPCAVAQHERHAESWRATAHPPYHSTMALFSTASLVFDMAAVQTLRLFSRYQLGPFVAPAQLPQLLQRPPSDFLLPPRLASSWDQRLAPRYVPRILWLQRARLAPFLLAASPASDVLLCQNFAGPLAAALSHARSRR
ncbi:uncharacterized protein K452DRAFT_127170 [Aplosporella prunicola CBS 121167]|uniref:Uncharacterized protein n=1 Tax=Aplosporella prunicola CBS 121167 TaxID=1176127 RepID=A0A6A6B0W6_9PEZI|nr:uncharacterized protein K452DRAFT_127170 [Aplosporella prunicola CBS 121167]KAF2136667.1 hypothetical protein K452DRAFT_127170 [Aplosporella prunicola CBS 121167]